MITYCDQYTTAVFAFSNSIQRLVSFGVLVTVGKHLATELQSNTKGHIFHGPQCIYRKTSNAKLNY